MEEKKIYERLPVGLTGEEKVEYTREMIVRLGEVRQTNTDIDRQKEAHKARIKELETKKQELEDRAYHLRDCVDRGTEIRPVECYEVPHYGQNTVTIHRIDTGEQVSAREMRAEERQVSLIEEKRRKLRAVSDDDEGGNPN